MNYNRSKQLDRAGLMNNLINSGNVSPDGADFLTLRLDPYHDYNRPISGYPDADSADTVVSILNYEANYSQPTALGANWDAHIFTMPFDTATFTNATSTGGQIVLSEDTFSLGLVNVARDAAGGHLFPTANPVVSANFTCESVNAFEGVSSGLSRVIGFGFEVQDTTAVLHKQGALTAYKMPTNTSGNCDVGILSVAGLQSNNTVTVINTPPSTVAEAVLYRGSVQWEARAGAYCIVGQDGVENPFQLHTKSSMVLCGDPTLQGADQCLVTHQNALTALQVAPLLTASTSSQYVKTINCTQNGVMLTGLHQDATFKVRVRVYVERAPMRVDTDLIPLATPSAIYDVRALELYSRLVTELPCAVPVGFNARGDWWKIIVNLAKKLVPSIGKVLTPIIGPEAMLIGNAIGDLIPKQTLGKKNTRRVRKVKQIISKVDSAVRARKNGPI